MTTEILRSSIDLFRRLPSSNIATNLDLVLGLLPELTEDILAEVDQPLQVKVDSSGKEYLVSLNQSRRRRRTRRLTVSTTGISRATTIEMETPIGEVPLSNVRKRKPTPNSLCSLSGPDLLGPTSTTQSFTMEQHPLIGQES